MARFLSPLPDASIFMGNPIVYTVMSAAISDPNASFHRVQMDVTIGTHHFPLSRPIGGTGNEQVEFDVSSCFRAVAALDKPNPTPSAGEAYPTYTATITIKDVWVAGGEQHETTGADLQSTTYTALRGQFSDYERLAAATDPDAPASGLTATLTRKPVGGELVCAGDDVLGAATVPDASPSGIAPVATITPVPTSSLPLTSIPTPRGALTVVRADAQPSVQFRFVNSRGVVESIRAYTYYAETAAQSSQQTVISVFERLRAFSRTYQHKQAKPPQLAMTSGYVSRAWAEWWAYEFCQAEHVWMQVEGHWLPVLIIVKESLPVVDTSKRQLLHVDFTVQPDLNGGLF